MPIQSENKTHERTCSILESSRQAAVAAAGSSAAAIRTAEISYYRSIISSCVTNNLPFSKRCRYLLAMW